MTRLCALVVSVVVLVAMLAMGGCSGTVGGGGNAGPAVALQVLRNQIATAYWSGGTSTIDPRTLLAAGGSPGVAGYTWSEPAGSTMRIPFGCMVSPLTGVFQASGAQLVGPGDYPFLIEVSDGTRTAQGTVTLRVREVAIAPIAVFQQFMGIGVWQLPNAQANRPYGHSLAALGGVPPYTWAEDTTYAGRTEFALSGLVIDQARGIVRGTINNSAAGQTLRFRVIVTDSTGATAVTDGLTYEIVVG